MKIIYCSVEYNLAINITFFEIFAVDKDCLKFISGGLRCIEWYDMSVELLFLSIVIIVQLLFIYKSSSINEMPNSPIMYGNRWLGNHGVYNCYVYQLPII
jgi:hypothetical protein